MLSFIQCSQQSELLQVKWDIESCFFTYDAQKLFTYAQKTHVVISVSFILFRCMRHLGVYCCWSKHVAAGSEGVLDMSEFLVSTALTISKNTVHNSNAGSKALLQ